jgi:hypothetical protein
MVEIYRHWNAVETCVSYSGKRVCLKNTVVILDSIKNVKDALESIR